MLRLSAKSLLTYHRETENGSELVVSAKPPILRARMANTCMWITPLVLFQPLTASGLEKFSGGLGVGDDVIADSEIGLLQERK